MKYIKFKENRLSVILLTSLILSFMVFLILFLRGNLSFNESDLKNLFETDRVFISMPSFYTIKFSYWVSGLIVLILISEMLRGIANAISEAKQELESPINNINKFLFILTFSAISLIGFYYLSKYMKPIVNELPEKSSISTIVAIFIPQFTITTSTLLKIIILTVMVYIALRAWLDMNSGESKSKKIEEELRAILSDKNQFDSQNYYKLSQKEDINQLVKWIKVLNGNKKSSLIKKEIIKLLRHSINSLIKTKDVNMARTTTDMAFLNLESIVYKGFSRSRVAQATLPLLGFGGTILGIMISMGGLRKAIDPNTIDKAKALGAVIDNLGVAFDTTLIAVILAFLIRSIERTLMDNTNEYLIKSKDLLRLKLFGKISN